MMKRFLSIVYLTCIASTCSLSQVLFSDGLVGYFPFNRNCFDYSNTLNHGRSYGSANVTGHNNENNNALSVHGYPDFLRIPHHESYISSEKTIAFWFYKNTDEIQNTPGLNDVEGLLGKAYDTGLNRAFTFAVSRNSDGQLTVYACVGTQDGKITFAGHTRISHENWYHMACVLSEESIKVYMNGILKDIKYLNSPIINNYEPIVIGKATTTAAKTRYFNGRIDELQLYNKALSEDQIKELYSWDTNSVYPSFLTDKTPDFEKIDGTSIGSAWADYDNDGDEDLFIANEWGNANAIYTNNGNGTFSLYNKNPIQLDFAYSTAGIWADIDNDTDLDLFVSNKNHENNVLYINQDNGLFTKIINKNIVTDGASSMDAAWADYDRDGYLDLFIANKNGENNLLYRNKGDGNLKKINLAPITTDGGNSRACAWGDYNNDNWPDLFVANNNFENNFLYKNNGDGTFEKIIHMDAANDSAESWGGSWGDMDNDGDLDLYVINGNSDNFYYENINGSLTRATIMSTWGPFSTRGSSLGDYNNDGQLDIALTHRGWHGLLYLSRSDNQFEQYYLPKTNDGQSISHSDMDNDGDLDLYLTYNGTANVLLENQYTSANWIKIKCQGVQSNFSAIGAKVRIKADCGFGSKWQMREISSHSGPRSQNSLICHFGLGTADHIDILQIEWPSGIIWDTTNVAINQQHLMIEHIKVTQPPVAVSDSATVFAGQANLIAPMANDQANEPGPLVLVSINSQSTLGQAERFGDNILYTAPTYYQGLDSLYYTIQNSAGLRDSASIIIKVNLDPATYTPIACPDSILIVGNEPIAFFPLENDTANSDNGLTILNCDTSMTLGSVQLIGDTAIVYTAIYGFIGDDSLSYVIGNGTGMTDTTTIIIRIEQPTEVADRHMLPSQFDLLQNYPNPFNPATTIPYVLATDCQVRITIFDAVGREVRILVEDTQSAGNYRAVWDGRNTAGVTAPTGMYFVRMETEQFKATKKLLLLR